LQVILSHSRIALRHVIKRFENVDARNLNQSALFILLGSLLQALVSVGILTFEQRGDQQVILFYLGQVDVLDMHQPYKLPHRSGHISPALVPRGAALGNADLAPEVMLVKAQFASDFTRILYFFKEFHESALKVKWLSLWLGLCYRIIAHT
jgi:hypothetical protein